MEVTGLRVWQWMIIGTVAGAAVGFAWINQSNDLDGRTGSKDDFRRLVQITDANAKRGRPPVIRNIVVREPEYDPSKVLVYPVTYEYLTSAARRPWQARAAAKNGATAPEPEWQSDGIYASTPFHGGRSIKEYLEFAKLPYADRTGSGKWIPFYYSTAGGFVAIGLLWPAAIQLMIRAGLAKAPPPRPKKERAKHRTGEDVDEMLTKAAPKKVDGGALDTLNDQMEASLAASLSSGGPRTTTAAVAEEPVSLFAGGSSRNTTDPTEAPVPTTPQEKKDYGGEYYPVAKKVKKHDETH